MLKSNPESDVHDASHFPGKRWKLLVILFVGLVPIAVQANSGGLTEYQVKAGFLYNFAKFVEWPRDAFTSERSPINVCIYGVDPFAGALEEAVQDKTVGQRAFDVHRPRKLQDLGSCQILFVSGSEDGHLEEILESLKSSNTLVVGESPHFAERGGDIQFVLEDGKIRFSINVDSVNQAQFRISSKLLALAKLVHAMK